MKLLIAAFVACMAPSLVCAQDPISYRIVATNKISTMQHELQALGGGGYQVVGMTVGKTLGGGNEIVTILRRPAN